MRILLETHLLIWIGARQDKVPAKVTEAMQKTGVVLYFSVINIWEIAIKAGLNRPDFQFSPELIRDGLLANSYQELIVAGDHALAVQNLPPIHRDPFDRMLIAQAKVEGLNFYTSDAQLARYGDPVRYFS